VKARAPASRNAHAALTAAATAILLRKHTPEERESAFVMVECAKEIRVAAAALERAKGAG
jgi:hypothetical protein